MAKADNPLKVLADRHADDYVSWLLSSGCQLLKKHPTDLPETERRADIVCEISYEDSTFILHVEFQQYRPSDEPMPFRMTEYAIRLWKKHHLPICGVVIYLLKEADVNDPGYFSLVCPLDKEQVMRCHYKVVRLWEIDGQRLLESNTVGLYPLIPLTRLENPEETLKQAIKEIRDIKQEQTKADLLFGTWLLSESKADIRNWLEVLIRREEMMESQLCREIMEEGRLIGLEEGKLIGLEEGKLKTLREAILDLLSARFGLTYRKMKQLEKKVNSISDLSQLRELLLGAGTVESLEEFPEAISS